MNLMSAKCCICNKKILRSKRRINESKKLGWKTFCSYACQSKARIRQINVICARKGCENIFTRIPSEFNEVNRNYCSQSCAAIENNTKRKKLRRFCSNPRCRKLLHRKQKYCSLKCVPTQPSNYKKETVLQQIRKFYYVHGRIPMKKDMLGLYKPARKFFNTWNKAIKAAGFEPNPVLFARKHIAIDGHTCDSLAEKIIDDWLYKRKVKHTRNEYYPGDYKFRVDFKVGEYWIEFFGLNGELKRYDELKSEKLRLVKKYKLRLIDIYPKDLFPSSKLEQVLRPVLSN